MRLLCIDEDDETVAFIEQIIPLPWQVERVSKIEFFTAAISRCPFDAVLLDVDFCRMQGISLLPMVIGRQACAPVIACSQAPSIDMAVQCIKLGANEYISKPITRDHFLSAFHRVLLNQRKGPAVKTGNYLTDLDIVRSGARCFLDILPNIKNGELHGVALCGEKGTGKYQLAVHIHEKLFCHLTSSRTTQHRFLSYVGHGKTSEQQYQELFGTDFGVWKLGASYPGVFERAGNGSVYIPEVSEINRDVQLAIFHALEGSAITRAMGRACFPIFCRILFGSQYSLDQLGKQNMIIPELLAFFRYRCVELKPLRERTDEIVPLAWYFLRMARMVFPQACANSFHPHVMELFLRHPWPENLQQFRDCVYHAVLNCKEPQIQVADLLHRLFQFSEAIDTPAP